MAYAGKAAASLDRTALIDLLQTLRARTATRTAMPHYYDDAETAASEAIRDEFTYYDTSSSDS